MKYKEKKILAALSKSFGVEVEKELAEDIEREKRLRSSILESVRSNLASDLKDMFKNVKKESPITNKAIPTINEEVENNSLIERTTKAITQQIVVEKDSFQQPNPPTVSKDLDSITKKLKFLEQAIGKIVSHGPGSGEVNLKYLDDVDRSTINDGLFLRYNSTNKKFEFDNNDHLTSSSLLNQSIANVSLAQVVDLGNVSISNNIELGSNSTIVFFKTNSYNIMPSIQLENRSSEQQDFNIWLRKNFIDVENTNSIFTVPPRKTPSIYGKMIATTPLYVDIVEGDVIQIMCHCDSDEVFIQTIASAGPAPAAPGVILVVTRI